MTTSNNGTVATAARQARAELLEKYIELNKTGECPYVGKEPEDCDSDRCGQCVLEVVIESLRQEPPAQ